MYLASKAGALLSIEVNSDDINFLWRGYNDKLKEFVCESVDHIVKLQKLKYNDKKKLFNSAKDELLQHLKNA